MKTIKELKKKDLLGKTVLLRVAYDVPLKQKGKNWVVANGRRIEETVPTINFLLKNNCKIVILSWLGRPSGQVVEKLKMDPVAKKLSQILKKPVAKVDDCVGLKVSEAVANLKAGQILMLENVRFHMEEEKNDKKFAKDLVKGMDLIVFDAFAQAHRIHSSTIGIIGLLPVYIGMVVEKELNFLNQILIKPKRPFVVVLGGAKISDKIGAIENLAKIADKILIGGGCANVFIKASGFPVGKSFLEDVFVDKAKRKKVDFGLLAKKLLAKYSEKIVLPVDFVSAEKADVGAKTELVNLAKSVIKNDWTFLDIGPETVNDYLGEIKKAKAVLWNGPMGMFEINKFATGTKRIAKAIADARAITVIGGGDTETAAAKYKLEKKFTHISTAGGAMLDFLATGNLPVIKALK
ncbi:MAG: phosphoglycerate kinase [Candidatus Vogelbacteria bacterium]|nr:phosphoglycerate kinase [Candidatus Vogelbacteria bacterium]